MLQPVLSLIPTSGCYELGLSSLPLNLSHMYAAGNYNLSWSGQHPAFVLELTIRNCTPVEQFPNLLLSGHLKVTDLVHASGFLAHCDLAHLLSPIGTTDLSDLPIPILAVSADCYGQAPCPFGLLHDPALVV